MSLLNEMSQILLKNNRFSLAQANDCASSLCHAWFISQDAEHPEYQQAKMVMNDHVEHPVIQFIHQCLPFIEKELAGQSLPQTQHPLWSLFSPEALECEQQPQQVRGLIQESRTISRIERPDCVISDVADEVLLTSNVLLGIPLPDDDISHLQLSEHFHQVIEEAQLEPQQYWYDHPIPIGISAAENEVLYGLKHLDLALDTEVERGNLTDSQKLTVVLSCSVTHPSLAHIAKEYVEYEIASHLNLKHLTVVVFGENECQSVLASTFPTASQALKEVFGVNGAYGRHYTFLKAIAPLWQKAVNPKLKGTFKFDLDQIFVQSMLIEQTGSSFFELIIQSNWGSNGVDAHGQDVHLGMIAGGLVNESDAHLGLFTPDVKVPSNSSYALFEQLFCARWPQAISTEEEIVSRRTDLQRVHVTGGTNGILIESLYKFRPFTPTFIHRAEDQAFILSLLAHPVEGQHLVYSHQPGLIMRHDKDMFAGRAMQVAESGKVLGDIERVLLFSAYAKCHPLGVKALKQKLYPFTGTFISSTPVTLALLRFLLEGSSKNADYLNSGAIRLGKCLEYCQNSLEDEVKSNQVGWDEYYQTLQTMVLPDTSVKSLLDCIVVLNS